MQTGRSAARRWVTLAAGGCLLAGGVALRAEAAKSPAPAREVRIRALDGLRFDQPRFRVQPGERIRLVFENADVSGMQHNLLITRPGAREEVVKQALALGAQGPALNFAPRTERVLWTTPLLAQDGSYVLEFTAPSAKSVFPFVCTFPGHGFVMYGAMYVGVGMPPLAMDPHVPPGVREEARAASGRTGPIERPKLYRYLMPNASPAAIAVALPGDQNFTWDAGAVRLRYAWRGEFVDRSESLYGTGGTSMQVPAQLLGPVYYRAGDAYPIRVGRTEGTPSVRFRGYRLIDGIPEFRYEVDGVEVRERITARPEGDGLVRAFRVGPTEQPVFFVAEPGSGVAFEASAGRWTDGVLRLTGREAARFTITMIPGDSGRGTR